MEILKSGTGKCAHSFPCFNAIFKAIARALRQRKSSYRQERMKSKHSFRQSEGGISHLKFLFPGNPNTSSWPKRTKQTNKQQRNYPEHKYHHQPSAVDSTTLPARSGMALVGIEWHGSCTQGQGQQAWGSTRVHGCCGCKDCLYNNVHILHSSFKECLLC